MSKLDIYLGYYRDLRMKSDLGLYESDAISS